MPPRVAAPLMQARAKATAPKQAALAMPRYEQAVSMKQEQTTCPLCIEDLDATDITFLPCPCGYRVCLFCYGKIKEMCNSQCPGCRREYGEAQQLPPDAGGGDAGTPALANGRAAHNAAGALHGAGGPAPQNGVRAVPARAVPPPPPPARRVEAGKRMVEEPGLPSGATWANQVQQRVAEPPDRPAATPVPPAAPSIADASAWPDLAAPVQLPPPPTRPVRMVQDDSNHRRSTSAASSMDHVPSGTSLDMMSQDPVVAQPEHMAGHYNSGLPLHMAGTAAQTAQVSTSVLGSVRPINVVLATAGTQPEPSIPEIKAHMLQQVNDVRNCMISNQVAGAQLMALLGQRNNQDGPVTIGRVVPVPVKAPPPGFGGLPIPRLNLYPNNTALSPHHDIPITSMNPSGGQQPIGKPLQLPPHLQQHQQQQQQQQPPERVYNLWSGFDLRPQPYDPYVSNMGRAPPFGPPHWQQPPGFPTGTQGLQLPPGFAQPGLLGQGHGATANGHGYHHMPFSHHQPVVQAVPIKPPPPGFGGLQPQQLQGLAGLPGEASGQQQANGHDPRFTIGLHPHMATGFGGQTGVVGGGGLMSARGPPPGMNGFRPAQLGTGV